MHVAVLSVDEDYIAIDAVFPNLDLTAFLQEEVARK